MSVRDFVRMISALCLAAGFLIAITVLIVPGLILGALALVGLLGANVIETRPRQAEPPRIVHPREVGRDWDAIRREQRGQER